MMPDAREGKIKEPWAAISLGPRLSLHSQSVGQVEEVLNTSERWAHYGHTPPFQAL
jgi:hypothetical protein